MRRETTPAPELSFWLPRAGGPEAGAEAEVHVEAADAEASACEGDGVDLPARDDAQPSALAGEGKAVKGRATSTTLAAMAAFLLHGPDDEEHPDRGEGLQSRLAALPAQLVVERVRGSLRQAGDYEGEQLLDDLCHPDTDHRWLWVLCAADSTVLSRDEFVDTVRLRLGADLAGRASECARCGALLDKQCRHALRCAPGPATQGHNRVRDTLLGLASLSDGAAATEVIGLVSSAPSLRPADVLTTAAFGRLTALDVGIANPAARTAGDDACSSMVRRKEEDCAAFLDELAEDGVVYTPVVWTCWGRPHADASAAVRSMAHAAARRQGSVRAEDLERRARCALGVQLWKRAARMVAACRPSLCSEDAAAVLPTAVAAARARLGDRAGKGPDRSFSPPPTPRGSSCSGSPGSPCSVGSRAGESSSHPQPLLPAAGPCTAAHAATACGPPAAAPAAASGPPPFPPRPPGLPSSSSALAGGAVGVGGGVRPSGCTASFAVPAHIHSLPTHIHWRRSGLVIIWRSLHRSAGSNKRFLEPNTQETQ